MSGQDYSSDSYGGTGGSYELWGGTSGQYSQEAWGGQQTWPAEEHPEPEDTAAVEGAGTEGEKEEAMEGEKEEGDAAGEEGAEGEANGEGADDEATWDEKGEGAAMASRRQKAVEQMMDVVPFLVPSITEFNEDLRMDQDHRTIIVGPIGMADMKKKTIFLNMSSCTNVNVMMDQSNTEGELKGVIQLTFGSVELATKAKGEISNLKQGIKVEFFRQVTKVEEGAEEAKEKEGEEAPPKEQEKDADDPDLDWKDMKVKDPPKKEKKRKIRVSKIKPIADFRTECSLDTGPPSNKNIIAICSLATDVTEEQIKAAFPKAIRVVRPTSVVTHDKKGYAYVFFKTPEEAQEMKDTTAKILEVEHTCFALENFSPVKQIVWNAEGLNLESVYIDPYNEKIKKKLTDAYRACSHYLKVDYLSKDQQTDVQELLDQICKAMRGQNNYTRRKRKASQGNRQGGQKRGRGRRGGNWNRGGGGGGGPWNSWDNWGGYGNYNWGYGNWGRPNWAGRGGKRQGFGKYGNPVDYTGYW